MTTITSDTATVDAANEQIRIDTQYIDWVAHLILERLPVPRVAAQVLGGISERIGRLTYIGAKATK
jgi:hypothetical protein